MRYVLLYNDEEGNWIAEVPSLPGCNSNGVTRDDALVRIKEAMSLWIEDALEHGEEIPPEYVNPDIIGVEQPVIAG